MNVNRYLLYRQARFVLNIREAAVKCKVFVKLCIMLMTVANFE